MPHPVPNRPYYKVGVDLFDCNDKSHIGCDYSNYPCSSNTANYLQQSCNHLPEISLCKTWGCVWTVLGQWPAVLKFWIPIVRWRLGIPTQHLQPQLPKVQRLSREFSQNCQRSDEKGTRWKGGFSKNSDLPQRTFTCTNVDGTSHQNQPTHPWGLAF